MNPNERSSKAQASLAGKVQRDFRKVPDGLPLTAYYQNGNTLRAVTILAGSVKKLAGSVLTQAPDKRGRR